MGCRLQARAAGRADPDRAVAEGCAGAQPHASRIGLRELEQQGAAVEVEADIVTDDGRDPGPRGPAGAQQQLAAASLRDAVDLRLERCRFVAAVAAQPALGGSGAADGGCTGQQGGRAGTGEQAQDGTAVKGGARWRHDDAITSSPA